MKVLIAEDDKISRRLMQGIIAPYGSCQLAVNGQEAVEAFKLAFIQKEPFDLVCLDIMMPEMNGHEVLEEIRNFEDQNGVSGLAGVKIIMVTALDDPKTIMKAFRQQCEDYIIKPISKSVFLDKVKKLCLI